MRIESAARQRGPVAVLLSTLDRRFWVTAVLAGLGSLIVLGAPTAVIPNPLFTRMLPTEPINLMVLLLSAPLMGLLIATYLAPAPGHARDGDRDAGRSSATLAGIGSFLAIGCPVCNKIVVAVLGISGAINVFAPLQPLIGVLSLVTLSVTLAWRLRRRAHGCATCAGIASASPD